MSAPTVRRTTCARCDGALPEWDRESAGRPRQYCSVSCRQAAQRDRRRAPAVEDRRRARIAARAALADAATEAKLIARGLAAARLDYPDERHAGTVADLDAAVLRVRQLAAAHDHLAGSTWTAIGEHLGVGPGAAQALGAAGARFVHEQQSTVEVHHEA